MSYTKEIKRARRSIRQLNQKVRTLEVTRNNEIYDKVNLLCTKLAKKYDMHIEEFIYNQFKKVILSTDVCAVHISMLKQELRIVTVCGINDEHYDVYSTKLIPLAVPVENIINKLTKILTKTHSIDCNLKKQKEEQDKRLQEVVENYHIQEV